MKTKYSFVYVLGTIRTQNSEDIRTYVGWTNDLDARLAKHNAGIGAKTTRGRRWRLLYVEIFYSRSEAMSREWHIKKDSKLRKNLKENWLI